MSSESTPVICPRCGTSNPAETKFCTECGRSLRVSGSLATFGPRYAAFLVDITVVLGVWFIVTVVSTPLASFLPIPRETGSVFADLKGNASVLLNILLLPLTAIAYFTWTGRKGGSIGLRILSLRLVTLEGDDPGLGRSAIRALVAWGPLLMLMLGQLLGLIGSVGLARGFVTVGAPLGLVVWAASTVMSFTVRRRGLHDLAAGTQIVRS